MLRFKLPDSLNTGYVRDLSFERDLFSLTYCVVRAIYSSIDNYILSRQWALLRVDTLTDT